MNSEIFERIEQTYSQAASEMQQKFRQYMKDFERKDTKKRELVDAGLLSQEEYAKWRKGQVLIGRRWKEMRDVLAEDLTHADDIALSIINRYLPEEYALGHAYGTFLVEKASQIGTSYTLYDRRAVERLVKYEPRLLPVTKWELDAPKDLRWNQQHITQQITQGILQGESLPQVADRLQRVVGMDERAAMRNARTALTGAQNAGRIDAYRRSIRLGFKTEKEWLATMDNVTRDSHIDVDGEHIPLDDRFSNGMDYPGGNGPPEETYNCRCTLIPRVLGVDYSKSDLDRWKAPELGDMTYEEWKSTHAGRDKPAATPTFNKDEWVRILYSQDYDVERKLIGWCDDFVRGLRGDEEEAVTEYTGESYWEINRHLRGIESTSYPYYMDIIQECTAALRKGFIPEDVIVRRGAGLDALTGMLGDKSAPTRIASGDIGSYVGAIFTDKGFVSTSPFVRGGFSGDVEMVIMVPKGSQAAYVDPISANRGEKELLIQRSQRYRVEHLEVVEGRYGRTVIRMFCTLLGGAV